MTYFIYHDPRYTLGLTCRIGPGEALYKPLNMHKQDYQKLRDLKQLYQSKSL